MTGTRSNNRIKGTPLLRTLYIAAMMEITNKEAFCFTNYNDTKLFRVYTFHLPKHF